MYKLNVYVCAHIYKFMQYLCIRNAHVNLELYL